MAREGGQQEVVVDVRVMYVVVVVDPKKFTVGKPDNPGIETTPKTRGTIAMEPTKMTKPIFRAE